MANYNNGMYVAEAIESVVSQTYPLWELIIVDDCSSDNSVEAIQSFLKDKRIKLILHKRNRGYGGSLKTAADYASNTIFGILDSDDKLHETALGIMADAYKNNPDYGFIYSTCWGCDSELKNCILNTDLGKIIPKNKVFFRVCISHFKTFRRDDYLKTQGFDPAIKRAVDKDIIFKLEEVCKLKFINVPLYYRRVHERGISQGENEFLARIFFYITKYKAYQRRLHTNIPNCTLKDLYLEYFEITFLDILKFLKNLSRILRINILINSLKRRFPNLFKIEILISK